MMMEMEPYKAIKVSEIMAADLRARVVPGQLVSGVVTDMSNAGAFVRIDGHDFDSVIFNSQISGDPSVQHASVRQLVLGPQASASNDRCRPLERVICHPETITLISHRPSSAQEVFSLGERVCAVVSEVREDGRIRLSTRLLEAESGEMLRDSAGVFSRSMAGPCFFHLPPPPERKSHFPGARAQFAGSGRASGSRDEAQRDDRRHRVNTESQWTDEGGRRSIGSSDRISDHSRIRHPQQATKRGSRRTVWGE